MNAYLKSLLEKACVRIWRIKDISLITGEDQHCTQCGQLYLSDIDILIEGLYQQTCTSA